MPYPASPIRGDRTFARDPDGAARTAGAATATQPAAQVDAEGQIGARSVSSIRNLTRASGPAAAADALGKNADGIGSVIGDAAVIVNRHLAAVAGDAAAAAQSEREIDAPFLLSAVRRSAVG